MILLKDVNDSTPKVATIGFFDGCHVGHRFLLQSVLRIAAERGMESMVVSFENHPRLLFDPDCDLRLLTTSDEKRQLFGDCGLDYCLMLEFTREFASQTSREFISWLASRYGVRVLVVGYDHRFGCDRTARFEDYVAYGKEVGVEVIAAEELKMGDVEVSSTVIRILLQSGDIEYANSLLGTSYMATGVVTHGNKIGRTIGFPTANLQFPEHKLIPDRGVFAVEVVVDGQNYAGMLNIGRRPTVDGVEKTAEVHIIDFDDDIYGCEVTVRFVKYIRDERMFESLDALREQISHDKESVLEGVNIIRQKKW